MSEDVGRQDPHTAVKQELLVRYLDAWTPTVLKAYRRASYLEACRDNSAVVALRVFGEFADRLAGHQLDVAVLRHEGRSVDGAAEAQLAALGELAGLSLRAVAAPAELALSGPTLAHLDLADERLAWQLVESLAANPHSELLLIVRQATAERVTEYRQRLVAAGLPQVAHVELVDDSERAQLALFATSTDKHLTAFKDALWAVDEYAGIRYRDPRDPERSLIDISLHPQLLPLRRSLLAKLREHGEHSVADLQRHTLSETIYRPADAIQVLTSLASSGAVSRDPEKGRLTPRAMVRLGPSAAA